MPLDRVHRSSRVPLAIQMDGQRVCVFGFAALLHHPLSRWFKTCRGAVPLGCAELAIRPPCLIGWRSIGSFG